MKRIYLDYAAATPLDPAVFAAMRPYFGLKFGNPGSLHFFGQTALAAVDAAREAVAGTIGADFREIVFTGSATEANNLALRGAADFLGDFLAVAPQNQNNFAPAAKFSSPSARRPRFARTKPAAPAGRSSEQLPENQENLTPRIIVSAIEHESILETARDLEREGVEVVYLPVNREGIVDLEKLRENLNERAVLVSVMFVNNETGAVQPIAEIAKIVKAFRSGRLAPHPLLHTDAVQAFQYLDCGVEKLGVDLMTLSAHKIYGPKGAGGLYVKSFLGSAPRVLKSMVTGGEQEFGLRAGTENVPAIVGFAKAAELAAESRERESRRIGELADYFWRGIKRIFPEAEINGPEIRDAKRRIPNILNIRLPGETAENLLAKLDLAGVAASSGSACRARAFKPSHVLGAMGLSPEEIKSSLRFSFGRPTTKKETGEALKCLKTALAKKPRLR